MTLKPLIRLLNHSSTLRCVAMKDSCEENPKIVILGQIGKVYGIKGWLKLSSFTSLSKNIFNYTELMVRLGDSVETLKIEE